MNYARPPFPPQLYAKFNRVAQALGYTVRGQKWALLDMLMDYAELHPSLFTKR